MSNQLRVSGGEGKAGDTLKKEKSEIDSRENYSKSFGRV